MMDSILLEEPSSSIAYGGGRAIDRHNPIIRDEKRLSQGRIFPSSPTITITTPTTVDNHHQDPDPEAEASGDQKRKSIVFAYNHDSDSISPASSSRCLLSDKPTLINFSSDFQDIPPPSPPSSPPLEPLNFQNRKTLKNNDELISSPPPTQQPPLYEALSFLNLDHDDDSPPKSPHESLNLRNCKASNKKHHDQVVVLEVSLHCRGCERKMKKHISKIEGVTSFKIEFAAKKVTVVGDVTPLAVLTSVLKVKNAKLLTPATISSSAPIEPSHLTK